MLELRTSNSGEEKNKVTAELKTSIKTVVWLHQLVVWDETSKTKISSEISTYETKENNALQKL